MWPRISLRTRIYTLLSALACVTVLGGVIMLWYSFQMESVMTFIFGRNLAAYQAAEGLETALINQKGFVTYYFLDGNPDWLRQLGEYRQIFKERLARAYRLVENNEQKHAIEQIEIQYSRYIEAKDRVIALYKAEDRNAGAMLHRVVRNQFFDILTLCENFKAIHLNQMQSAQLQTRAQAHRLRIVAVTALFIVILLASVLAFILIRYILSPIRRLSASDDAEGVSKKPANEIMALSHRVTGLMEDIDKTHSELEKSREHLLQAEKMALVGKLAAGMAHSIRNPFTSVKMRLFSLGRTLELSDTQKDDLEVISAEIRHIDTIVQNFLEFSRPPKLQMQPISPSSVVDAAVQLLEHRLKSYDVTIEVVREFPLADIQADPEQLKEVLVNLIVNACEAMDKGGAIIIKEEERLEDPLGRVAVIQVSDTGPGISESNMDKVLQPFFTTKEEGTGLGLSITARIVNEHKGRLNFTSTLGKGTTFSIVLPLQVQHDKQHIDH